MKKLYNNKLNTMENQGKSERQMRSSYIGAFIGFVGILIMCIVAIFS